MTAEMPVLVDYGSSDDEAGPSSTFAPAVPPPASRVVAAPDVSLEVSQLPLHFLQDDQLTVDEKGARVEVGGRTQPGDKLAD